MPFPDSPRVIYDSNPLEEVICQLKFPPILMIDSAPPAAFQNDLRSTYPLFNEIPGMVANLPAEVMKMVPGLSGTKSYQFESPDGTWKVSLNREFVALSTTVYSKWEDFRTRLEAVLNALTRHYAPTFFVRLGLRYRDAIRRSSLGIANVEWTELLQPWILGELSQPQVASYILQTTREVLISLNGTVGKVRLRHGLIRPPEQGEPYYVIDSDFFREERTERNDVINVLNVFNREAGKLFRWCIRDTLHDKLGPRAVAAAR